MTANAKTETVQAELRHIAPGDLIIADNIRTAAEKTITADFVQSIKDGGVRQPIAAAETEAGVVVVDGHRRTLGAIKAGVATLPAYVRTATASTSSDPTVERIGEQWITNEQRVNLTAADKAAAVEQLALAGLTPAKIAKLTKAKRPDIDAALAVSKASDDTKSLIAAQPELTLDQSAILSSWDHTPHVQQELIEALATGQFDHVAQRWENERADLAAIDATTAQLRQEGYSTILYNRPRFGDPDLTDIDNLYTADGTRAGRVDNLIEGLPKDEVAVYICIDSTEETFWLKGTDKQIAEESIDWSLEDLAPSDPTTPGEGLIDPRTIETREEPVTTTEWFIRNHESHGLFTYHNVPRTPAAPAGQAEDTTTDLDTTDPEAAQAERVLAAAAARAAAEAQQKEERRRVRILNKAGLAAQEVRRAKLAEALARKTLPKGKAATVTAFIATTTWSYHHLYGQCSQDADAQKITTDLLGGTDPLDTVTAEGTTAERRQIISLAIVLGAHEANLPKDAWRGGHEYLRSIADARRDYLHFLADVFGYTLADIEQVVTGDKKADSIPLD